MEITATQVKALRDKTGAAMMLCKQALQAAEGNEEEATVWLRQKGIAIADGKAGRATAEGCIGSYVHTGGKIGVLVEVQCETDFVARSPEFQEVVRNLGMQIAACPSVSFVSIENIPSDDVDWERNVEMGKEDLVSKPEAIRAKIVEGRVAKRLKEFCLMEQPFIKDGSLTVEQYVKEFSGKVGENIRVANFVRLCLGG
jgi:elongation factor Ts